MRATWNARMDSSASLTATLASATLGSSLGLLPLAPNLLGPLFFFFVGRLIVTLGISLLLDDGQARIGLAVLGFEKFNDAPGLL